jgi:hypothetical protein
MEDSLSRAAGAFLLMDLVYAVPTMLPVDIGKEIVHIGASPPLPPAAHPWK